MTVSKTVRRGSSPWRYAKLNASMEKLVNSADLKSAAVRLPGSSPGTRTKC